MSIETVDFGKRYPGHGHEGLKAADPGGSAYDFGAKVDLNTGAAVNDNDWPN